jgi:hypothetical protein
LLPSKVGIRSVKTLDDVNVIQLPHEIGGPVLAFLWSPSSTKVLVAVADQIHVFSALDNAFHAVIRNPAAASGKPSFVCFGPDDHEVCVCSVFGLRFAVFNLSTSKAVEVNSPKFYHAASASRGFSFRPGTSHMALLTRVSGKDVVSLHHPVTRQVQRSWQPDTVDAQGLTWTPDGKWLLVWESPSQGHKVLFYTPDGHLFRSWTGARGSSADDPVVDLAPGVKFCQQSRDASRVAVGDYSRRICIIDTISVTEAMRLDHPMTVTPADTLQASHASRDDAEKKIKKI